MKSAILRILCLVLCLAMVIPLAVACADTGETGAETDTVDAAGVDTTVTEAVTEETPYVEKANYGETFTAIYCSDIFQKGYFFVDPNNMAAGNDLDDKLYEREVKVEEYLGVTIEAIDGGGYTVYTSDFENNVTSGDDDYQMLMTHSYMNISKLITGNYLYDMGQLDSLDLDADYWNSQLMEDLSINDKMYLGYNDFCLSNCFLVAFNKTMYEHLEPVEGNLYDLVREGKWTLDKMISVASKIEDDKDADTKNYGLALYAWVPLTSFVTASDLKIVDKDDVGDLYVAASVGKNEKLISLHEKLYNLCNADYVYAWGPPGMKKPSDPLTLEKNRSLMNICSNYQLVTLKGESVKFGVLPYPKYEESQTNYQTLSWNGMLAVASSIKNPKMVGDTMEMLAYYSDDVTVSFYETLLGAKVANAPEDAEMLDRIWASQVSDLGLVFCDISANMDAMVYAIPQCVTYKDQKELSSHIKANAKRANTNLQKLFQEK